MSVELAPTVYVLPIVFGLVGLVLFFAQRQSLGLISRYDRSTSAFEFVLQNLENNPLSEDFRIELSAEGISLSDVVLKAGPIRPTVVERQGNVAITFQSIQAYDTWSFEVARGSRQEVRFEIAPARTERGGFLHLPRVPRALVVVATDQASPIYRVCGGSATSLAPWVAVLVAIGYWIAAWSLEMLPPIDWFVALLHSLATITPFVALYFYHRVIFGHVVPIVQGYTRPTEWGERVTLPPSG